MPAHVRARALLLAGLLTWLAAGTPAAASLCRPDESAVFSCHTGSKQVALCASHDLSASAGTLYYRFGRPGRLELVYPSRTVHPRLRFQRGTTMYAGGGGDYVRFTIGVYQYTVYSEIGRDWEREGIAVHRQGRLVRRLPCRDLALGEAGWGPVYAAGLPVSRDTLAP